eukprot:Gregarina_sp_Pseudo_9__2214@NODE_2554_length_956_cov_27_836423_g2342_i0_p1_GENE_NODE_2554_length_956_cov_27_836423_g2342_i0NODE_2554_length_956_cov_27_836423_g2342_i0_p1_ORF_typecomplete_len262_score24_87_NODE_2554_length_956_cov_27_836423_g2342_i0133918
MNLRLSCLVWGLASAASPFAKVSNHQVRCEGAGSRCQDICAVSCANLQPVEFAKCLKEHKASRCQFRHTENYMISAKHICLDPLLGLHAFVYDTSQVVPLYEPPRQLQRVLREESAHANIIEAFRNKGRKLQSSSSQDSILEIWGWMKFEYLRENCTLGVNHRFPTKAVCGVGPYDDLACVHNKDLWNSNSYVDTYISGESPATVWVDLTDVPIRSLEGEVYEGIQVWADISACYEVRTKAYQAGLQFTVLFDFMSYEKYA